MHHCTSTLTHVFGGLTELRRYAADVPPTAVGACAIDVHRWRMGHRCMLQVERQTPHNPLSVPFNLEQGACISKPFSYAGEPDVDRMRTQ